MCTTIRIVLAMVREAFLSRAALHLENLALRQQLAALDRKGAQAIASDGRSPFLGRPVSAVVGLEGDPGDRQAGDGYRLASKGLPTFLDPEVATGEAGTTARVERIPRAYPPDVSGESVVGRSRIHGELRMLGFEVSEAAVSKYMPRHPKPPSQTWRTFLENHVGCLASTDFFVVPTATFSLYSCSLCCGTSVGGLFTSAPRHTRLRRGSRNRSGRPFRARQHHGI